MGSKYFFGCKDIEQITTIEEFAFLEKIDIVYLSKTPNSPWSIISIIIKHIYFKVNDFKYNVKIILLNIEQPFTTEAVEEQILLGDPVTPSVETFKQQTSLLETPPLVNPSLSPALLNHVLENILCVDPNTSLVTRILVSEQITTIEEFAFLEKEYIDFLNLNRESIKTVPRHKLKNILQ